MAGLSDPGKALGALLECGQLGLWALAPGTCIIGHALMEGGPRNGAGPRRVGPQACSLQLPAVNSQRTAGRWRSGVSERAGRARARGAGGRCGHRCARIPSGHDSTCARLHKCWRIQGTRAHARRPFRPGGHSSPKPRPAGIPASACVRVFLTISCYQDSRHPPTPTLHPGPELSPVGVQHLTPGAQPRDIRGRITLQGLVGAR